MYLHENLMEKNLSNFKFEYFNSGPVFTQASEHFCY